MSAEAKARVGKEVAGWVESGMVLGLGTGSTAAKAIEALGRRLESEMLDVVGVPTSFFAERLARQCGIPLATLDEVEHIDLAFDGADEVDPNLTLIKGRGAAHTREKVVAAEAVRLVVLVDDSKMVEKLGTRMPVPVEVVPMAASPVIRRLERLGARCELRMGEAKDGPVVSDQGMWIVDAHFPGIDDAAGLSADISGMPGVVEHGIFVGLATDVLVGQSDGEVRHLRRRG
ncbi:MAG: ribose-5-phosphate isomerase RpiA [Rhodothermales bacterium]|nr:ribose-5-phosphate isomerase RpiA [Rhodothermales bacterium]MBO6779504.1 ribose-5-phosphate isomerase RpiA [Rhodothermales bacterium]